MATTTLFKVIQSELIKAGFNEFEDENGELVFFDEEYQFTTKILKYDDDVQMIIDRIFNGVSLRKREHDTHFKKMFMYRFINRNINRQTIEAFKFELMATFLSKEMYINTVYEDMEKYIQQLNTSQADNQSENIQTTNNNSTSKNRQAFSELPQNRINLDIENDIMTSANDNTISNNSQNSQSSMNNETTGKNNTENKSYQLDTLIKSSDLMKEILNDFDKKCFMQLW